MRRDGPRRPTTIPLAKACTGSPNKNGQAPVSNQEQQKCQHPQQPQPGTAAYHIHKHRQQTSHGHCHRTPDREGRRTHQNQPLQKCQQPAQHTTTSRPRQVPKKDGIHCLTQPHTPHTWNEPKQATPTTPGQQLTTRGQTLASSAHHASKTRHSTTAKHKAHNNPSPATQPGKGDTNRTLPEHHHQTATHRHLPPKNALPDTYRHQGPLTRNANSRPPSIS